MSFVHPLLLGGLLLAGIPVLLHLMMRQKPKHLPFPALRLLLQRHRTNKRQLQLRHLILLALRVLLVVLICLALARPKVFNEGLNLATGRPVAAILVFDTSYSMEYTSGGKTRLEEAIQRGKELLKELPEGSRVAVLDTADPSDQWLSPQSLAIDQARDRIAGLELRPAGVPVTTKIAHAYDMFARLDQDLDNPDEALLRFLYVFSDRTQASWDPKQVEALARLRERIPAPGVNAVFVDVGIDDSVDLAVADLELPRQVIPTNGKAIIRATVRASGAPYDTEVICRIDDVVVDRRPVKLDAGQSQVISFERGDLAPGPHQVVVSLRTTDATLAFDDNRFATFDVRGARKVLLLTDSRWNDRDDPFFAKALRADGAFDCEVKLTAEAGKLYPDDLARYQAICLLGLVKPGDDLWQKLDHYVRQGGGLAIIPGGEELELSSYNNERAQALLPARLVKVVEAPDRAGVFWNWDDARKHPLLTPFQEWRRTENVDFFRPGEASAFRYWEVKAGAGTADEVVAYAEKANRPALLERKFDRKKVRGGTLLFTVPLDDGHIGRGDRRGRWNDYLENSFFVVLAQKAIGYLAGDADEDSFNFLCGQTVPVSLPAPPRYPTYTIAGAGLRGPEAIVARPENQAQLHVTNAVLPGNYTVFGDGKRTACFSLNVAPDECLLNRVPVDQVETVLGEGSVLPLDKTVILRDALQSRWNQPVELLPWLMILLLLALAVENLLANKFYRREPAETDEAALAQRGPEPATSTTRAKG